MKNGIKREKRPVTPKMTNGLVQHITVEEPTNTQWVNRSTLFAYTCDFFISLSRVLAIKAFKCILTIM